MTTNLLAIDGGIPADKGRAVRDSDGGSILNVMFCKPSECLVLVRRYENEVD